MNEKMTMNDVSLHTVVTDEGSAMMRSVGWAVTVLALVALVALVVMSGTPAVETDATAAGRGHVAVEVAPASATGGHAYYTERYWQAAEARTAPAPAAEADYAYYTERYWNQSLREAPATVVDTEDFAFYTERYWNMGAGEAAGGSANGNEVDEDAYYTEQYWRRVQDQ